MLPARGSRPGPGRPAIQPARPRREPLRTQKLRDYYGVNVIPIDALPLADIDVRDVNETCSG
jgi:hypothetical protein